jgi:hypothetical protein
MRFSRRNMMRKNLRSIGLVPVTATTVAPRRKSSEFIHTSYLKPLMVYIVKTLIDCRKQAGGNVILLCCLEISLVNPTPSVGPQDACHTPCDFHNCFLWEFGPDAMGNLMEKAIKALL